MQTEKIKQQFDIVARQYDADRRCFIPCFDDYYERSLSLVKMLRPQAHSVADLGAGTGLLTQRVWSLYPEARFTLIDVSAEMLDVARQRFSGMEGFSYEVSDYSAHIDGAHDLICSALSIHHLEDDAKAALYQRVYEALPEGGCFVNLDQFCSDSPRVNVAFDEWWMNYINASTLSTEARAKWLERKALDREVSIGTTIDMLRRAGFKQVDCIYQFMKFATIMAVK